MREKKSTVCGILLGSHCSLDMASLILAQIDRDGARLFVYYYREDDSDSEQMAEALARCSNSHARMIPRGDVGLIVKDAEVNQGNYALVGTFYADVMTHLLKIGPKKGSAFKVLTSVVDDDEIKVVTLKLPTTKSHNCPTATCSTVRPADDLVIEAIVKQTKKAA